MPKQLFGALEESLSFAKLRDSRPIAQGTLPVR
jgi:hypothetical protein